MRPFLLLAIATAFAGCADVPAACQAYSDAYDKCANDFVVANGGEPSELNSSVCDLYEGETDPKVAARLECQAAAYNDNDCATNSGYTKAAQDAAACDEEE